MLESASDPCGNPVAASTLFSCLLSPFEFIIDFWNYVGHKMSRYLHACTSIVMWNLILFLQTNSTNCKHSAANYSRSQSNTRVLCKHADNVVFHSSSYTFMECRPYITHRFSWSMLNWTLFGLLHYCVGCTLKLSFPFDELLFDSHSRFCSHPIADFTLDVGRDEWHWVTCGKYPNISFFPYQTSIPLSVLFLLIVSLHLTMCFRKAHSINKLYSFNSKCYVCRPHSKESISASSHFSNKKYHLFLP